MTADVIVLQVGVGIMCVSVGWHANNARKLYSNASGRDEDLLSDMDKSNRKVDSALVPGLLAQLAPTINDEKQRQGLANMLASMPRDEREKALEKRRKAREVEKDLNFGEKAEGEKRRALI